MPAAALGNSVAVSVENVVLDEGEQLEAFLTATSDTDNERLANDDTTAPLDVSEAIISGKSYVATMAWR